jgi:hypothetical protein
MFFKHKFPIEVQKWIVGKRIPKDEESLQRLRVTNDQTVYLYLVTAKSVGLDKQQRPIKTQSLLTCIDRNAMFVFLSVTFSTYKYIYIKLLT